jgi:SAM-dependent methyltransferase
MIQERHVCRACTSGRLATILNLGELHTSDFPTPGDPLPPKAPLDLCQCDACGLVQLRHTVDPDQMFRHYWYRSGVNETMRSELADIVAAGMGALDRTPAVVLDVGANDGTLLHQYQIQRPLRTPYRVAYEPARNLAEPLSHHCDDLVTDYFPGRDASRLYRRSIDLLTSIACFYDLDEPHAFVAAVAELLAPGGIWIVQFQDLHQMIMATAFDNICHEHLVYYSLASFERLIAQHNLRVVHAERRAINGGSYRLFVMRNTAGPRDESVQQIRVRELDCERWQRLDRFAFHVDMMRRQIAAIVRSCKRTFQTIDLYGASTKGNTLLQYCGLGPDDIRRVWERSEPKWGRTTVTGIPIVSEDDGRAGKPDLLVCGIWQFREAMLQREADYLRHGGMVLFPLPSVDLISGSGQ